jgi:hypothetical protein
VREQQVRVAERTVEGTDILDRVPGRVEGLTGGGRDRRLGHERPGVGPQRHAADEPPGRSDGGSRVHPEVEGSDQRHRVDLRLTAAPHRAGDRSEASAALHDDREQRVRGALAAAMAVECDGQDENLLGCAGR